MRSLERRQPVRRPGAENHYRPAAVTIELPFDLDGGFDGVYGLEVTHASQELMRGRVAVRDELRQPAGLVHGGVYAAAAESLASTGTGLAVLPEGKFAVGLSNHTSFLRPITDGTIHAEATVKHRGRTTWVWEVEITDDAGRLCVLTRVTVAVRDIPRQDRGRDAV
jgi:1,4-dihydroxy-2-naphthoyl-CoA hydrolase